MSFGAFVSASTDKLGRTSDQEPAGWAELFIDMNISVPGKIDTVPPDSGTIFQSVSSHPAQCTYVVSGPSLKAFAKFWVCPFRPHG
jgi:hypothetical protein